MKNSMRFLLIGWLVLGFSLRASSQDSLAIAKEMYEMGMELYNFNTREQAKEMFIQATQYDPDFAQAYLMAGKANLLTVNKGQALPYLLKAYELDPHIDEEILFLIGKAYHYADKYDDAIRYYEAYRKQLAYSLDFNKSRKIYDLDWKIFECRNAKIYLAHPVDVTITNLGDNINTEYPEYAPLISFDEKTLVFTSRRPENTNPDLAEDFEYYEDVYISEFKDGQWSPARPMPSPINGDYHNSDVGLSPDGTVMYLYTDENGGDIVETRLVDGKWTTPKPVKGLINTPYLENSATISHDLKVMYFTSDKPGGYGGTDIYVSVLGDNGRWGKPRNLGPLINTERDEEAPFLSKSGKRLYFSSNGHAGMGDLDIYVAERDGDDVARFKKPVNMGYPINSAENDVFFVLNGDETRAYYSSVKSTSKGDLDIYQINLERWKPINIDSLANLIQLEIQETAPTAAAPLQPAPPLQPQPDTSTVDITLVLTVLDGESLDTLDARVALIDQRNQHVTTGQRTAKGSYEIVFKNKEYTTYKVKINKKGYLPYESVIHVIGRTRHPDKLYETIALNPIKESYSTVMNVYFGHDSDQPNSYEDIQYLEKLLKENPNLKVEISGHTDNLGPEAYNLDLSQRRADNIKKYLVEHGIDPERIIAIGYGMSRPIADNATRAGRRLNRRTEFKILQR